jgi:hypothetical protein
MLNSATHWTEDVFSLSAGLKTTKRKISKLAGYRSKYVNVVLNRFINRVNDFEENRVVVCESRMEKTGK